MSNSTILTIPLTVHLPIDELPLLVQLMTMDKSLFDYQIREIVIIALYGFALTSLLAVIYEAKNHLRYRKLYVKTYCREVQSSNEVTPGVYRVKRNRKYAPPRFPSPHKAEEV